VGHDTLEGEWRFPFERTRMLLLDLLDRDPD